MNHIKQQKQEERIMTMKEKYESTLQQMQKDATIRLKAANDSLVEKREACNECYHRIEDLKETKRTSFGKFLEVGKAIVGMYFKRTATPEEVEAIIEPCNTYVAAAGALPLEEETLEDLISQRKDAKEKQLEEQKLFSAIETVLSSLPEDE